MSLVSCDHDPVQWEMPLLLPLPIPAGSVKPVLESQAGHVGKVGPIPREQDGITREDDAGDFQIHRADAHAFTTILHEQISRTGVPREHGPGAEEMNPALQPLIGRNLAMRVCEAMNFR